MPLVTSKKYAAKDIEKKLETFSIWLSAKGAELITPTSEWEIVRFKSGTCKASVIYKNKYGQVSFTGNALTAWYSFVSGKEWRAIKPTRRIKVTPQIRTLINRDGENCFYCLSKLEDDITIEHLLSVTHGGPNHISNFVLSHKQCNLNAGHLSLMEKINIHVNGRMEDKKCAL